MEQVLAPNFKFKPKYNEDDDSVVDENTIKSEVLNFRRLKELKISLKQI